MKKPLLADALKLNIPERILLVEDLWDSIAAVPESIALTTAQKTELDRRLKAFHRNPAKGSPWAAVKKRLLSR